MNTWEQKLIGELIGLARATDGSEHLITESITQILADVLTAHLETETQYNAYFQKVDAAKRMMVPNCFLCANPCGRTAAFDMCLLEGESEPVRQSKLAILEELRTLAAAQRNPEQDRKLYRGLVLIGMEGYSSSELTALFA